MLARYKIYRGKQPPGARPKGVRQDTRYFRHHVLRPDKREVEAYLAAPSEAAWRRLRAAYLKLLEQRFREDRTAFDELAQLARDNNVYLGCSCPTKKNPRVDHCHTYLALQFMQRKYRDLNVKLPPVPQA